MCRVQHDSADVLSTNILAGFITKRTRAVKHWKCGYIVNNPISDRFHFTWSSHRVRCTALRLMPNWGSLWNTFLKGIWVRHPHDMLQPSYPASLRHRQDARFAVQFSKLVVHPSPPRSMLEHTAKDGPEDASLKHAQSVTILCSDGPGLVFIQDQCINVRYTSHFVRTWSLLVLSSRWSPYYARFPCTLRLRISLLKSLSEVTTVPRYQNSFTTSRLLPSINTLLPRWSESSHFSQSNSDEVDAIREAKKLERLVEDRATDVVV